METSNWFGTGGYRELKGCPDCGYPVIVLVEEYCNEHKFHIKCNKCGFRGENMETGEKAVEVWNALPR